MRTRRFAMTEIGKFINEAIDKAQEFAGDVKVASDKVIDQIQESAPEVVDSAIDKTRDLVDHAVDAAPGMIDDAKDEVKQLSLKIINDLGGKIHKSATDTLEAIAKSFGAKEVGFIFQDKALQSIDINSNEIAIDKSLKSQIEK